uniref:TNFR-Cys domain-containing protein n=1 Tax=Amphiprion ocellaris TaxID=80972 RepID=A0AAQ5XXB4_AMPOC
MFYHIDDIFLQLQLNKFQFSVRWCLQIKNNYNFQPYEMIWRRKLLTPATFLIIVMNVFTGQTLTCHPAEYQIGNECCPMCPAGLGLKVKTSCTTTSDAVCEPLDGFYCIDPRGNNCVAAQKHRICHPGQYINQKGTASTDTVCSDCSTGTFSDGTFTSCQPHFQCESVNLQLIKAGTVSTDAECGEKSSNVTVAVIISVVLFLLISAGLVSFFYFRRKKMPFRPAEKNRSSVVLSQPSLENGTESSEEAIPMRISSD